MRAALCFPPSSIGAFVVDAVIGGGGAAVVYRAVHPTLGEVALKVLRTPAASSSSSSTSSASSSSSAASSHDHAAREALAARKAANGNVVEVYAAGVDDGCAWIATEFVDGGTVLDRLRAGPLSPREAVDLVEGVVDGLVAAHAHGVVHRDLKPANLLLTSTGTVKIADFGVAVAPSFGSGDARVFGTPSYMSPEQARGEDVDARSDLFAVGTLFVELLTGANPWARATTEETLSAVDAARLPSLPSSTPPALRDLIEQLVQRDPELRGESARWARAALQRVSSTMASDERGQRA